MRERERERESNIQKESRDQPNKISLEGQIGLEINIVVMFAQHFAEIPMYHCVNTFYVNPMQER